MIIVIFSAAVIAVFAMFIGMYAPEKRVKQYLLVSTPLLAWLAYRTIHSGSAVGNTAIMILIVAIAVGVALYYLVRDYNAADESAVQTEQLAK